MGGLFRMHKKCMLELCHFKLSIAACYIELLVWLAGDEGLEVPHVPLEPP